MTLGQIAAKARTLTHTDTTSYPDANLLVDINVWYQKVVSMILESADESNFDDSRNTNYPIITTPMVAGQRDYSIPVSDKVLKIRRVDLTYDGSNYYRSTPLSAGQIPWGIGNDANLDQNYIKEAPHHDISYNSIFIYPMPLASDVALGGQIRIEYTRQITEFSASDYTSVLTDSTVVPGYDDPFHVMLAYGPAWEYAVSEPLPNAAALLQMLTDNELRLRAHYGRKELDRKFTFTPYMDDNFGR